METFILPVNLPAETNGPGQPQEMAQPAETFAVLLEKNYPPGEVSSGWKNVHPDEGEGGNGEFFPLSPTEFTLMNFPVRSVLGEKGISVPGPLDSAREEIPSSPAGLGQGKNLPGLLTPDPTPALRFEENIWPISLPNPEEVNTHPSNFETPEKGKEEGGPIPLFKGMNGSHCGAEAPKNSSPFFPPTEMSGQTFSATSVPEKEIFAPPGKAPKALDPSVLASSRHERSDHPAATEEVDVAKGTILIRESRSPSGQAGPFPKLDQELSAFPGEKFSGENTRGVPLKEPLHFFINREPSRGEGQRMPDTQGRPTSSPWGKEGATNFFAPDGKGPEGIAWSSNGNPKLQGMKVENLPNLSGTSYGGGVGQTAIIDSAEDASAQNTGYQIRLGNQEVYQQVGQKVIWSIRTHEERVKLILDPPQLGHLYMEITRSDQNIKATLWTDNPATKLTLETSQGEIQKIIENEGFRLEKFDVFVQQDWGRFPGNHKDSLGPYSWSPLSPLENKRPISTAPEGVPAVHLRGLHSWSKYLDFFV